MGVRRYHIALIFFKVFSSLFPKNHVHFKSTAICLNRVESCASHTGTEIQCICARSIWGIYPLINKEICEKDKLVKALVSLLIGKFLKQMKSCAWMCVCVCESVTYVCVCVCICVHTMSMWVCECCMCVHACVCMVYVRVHTHMHVCVYMVYVCIHTHVFMCMCVCLCAYGILCVYIHAHVCVWVHT